MGDDGTRMGRVMFTPKPTSVGLLGKLQVL